MSENILSDNLTVTPADGAGTAITGASGTGIGVAGTSTSQNGIQGTSTNAVGAVGISTSNLGGYFSTNPSSTNTEVEVVRMIRTTSGTAAANIGGYMGMYLEDASGNSELAAGHIWMYTNATHGAEASNIIFKTRLAGAAPAEAFRILSNGAKTTGAHEVTGVVTASNAANAITIGSACTMSSPPAIGGVAPAAGAFTTLGASDNISVSTAGKGINVKEGANARQGVSDAMVAGTITISTTAVTANSRIFLTPQTMGTISLPVAVGVTARTPGTSFVITSQDVTDTSTVAWEIFEPAA